MLRVGVDLCDGVISVALLGEPSDGRATVAHAGATDHFEEVAADLAARLCAAEDLDPSAISSLLVSTDQASLALQDPGSLTPIGLLRIGTGPTPALPPGAGWPDPFKELIRFGAAYRGGIGYDGRVRGLPALDVVRRDVRSALELGCRAFAVSCTFAALNPRLELLVEETIRESCAPAFVALSHEVRGVGLQDRENAAALDAMLSTPATRAVDRFRRAMTARGFNASLFLGRGDGTVLASESCLRHPATTIGSTAAAALTGAAVSTGRDAAIVVDARHREISVGAVTQARPQLTGRTSTIAGLRTSLPMPELLRPVSPGVSLIDAIRRMGGASAAGPVVVLAQGDGTASPGGPPGALPDGCGEGATVLGTTTGAFGIANSRVSAEALRILPEAPSAAEAVLEEAREEALERAIAGGADPGRVRISGEHHIRVSYLPGRSARLRVEASGPTDRQAAPPSSPPGAPASAPASGPAPATTRSPSLGEL